MKEILGFVFCCAFPAVLFSCKHRPATAAPPATTSSAAQIDSLIKAKEREPYALLTDTTKPAAGGGNHSSPYYSVTRFYYHKATKELFKAENILQATSKVSFVAYYEGSQVVKTSAHTEFGWYDDYYAANEQEDSTKKGNDISRKNKSPFRQQCWQLAKAQQSIFQRKAG